MFHHEGDFRTRTMFTGWDVSLDGPAEEDEFIKVRYDRAYEAGSNIAGASFGGRQRDYAASFAINIADGSPFTRGDWRRDDYIPVTERVSFRMLVTTRGKFFDVTTRLITRTGRPLEMFLSEEDRLLALERYRVDGPRRARLKALSGYQIIGEAGSFHGLTEIRHPDQIARFVENHQVYIPGTEPAQIDFFFVCSRAERFPNPQCDLYVEDGVFDMKSSFRRALMADWPQVLQLSRDFTQCLIEG